MANHIYKKGTNEDFFDKFKKEHFDEGKSKTVINNRPLNHNPGVESMKNKGKGKEKLSKKEKSKNKEKFMVKNTPYMEFLIDAIIGSAIMLMISLCSDMIGRLIPGFYSCSVIPIGISTNPQQQQQAVVYDDKKNITLKGRLIQGGLFVALYMFIKLFVIIN